MTIRVNATIGSLLDQVKSQAATIADLVGDKAELAAEVEKLKVVNAELVTMLPKPATPPVPE